MSDRCAKCGEVPNPDGSCACPVPGLDAPPVKAINNPLHPSASLLIKLGSVIVHQEEKASKKGHWMDQYALDSVRNDPEVVEWLDQMTKAAFLPVKR